jgi:hypothetical protein
VIAEELPPTGGFGRVRMGRVPSTSATSLTRFVREYIEPGALVKTDGWSGYKGLPRHGYRHLAVSIRASGDPAHVVMPAVHRVASLLLVEDGGRPGGLPPSWSFQPLPLSYT